jgi:hypothetical protein
MLPLIISPFSFSSTPFSPIADAFIHFLSFIFIAAFFVPPSDAAAFASAAEFRRAAFATPPRCAAAAFAKCRRQMRVFVTPAPLPQQVRHDAAAASASAITPDDISYFAIIVTLPPSPLISLI